MQIKYIKFQVIYIYIYIYIDTHFLLVNYTFVWIYLEAPGGAVGWDTALQAGRSQVRFLMVSLAFFIDTILPAALCPWGWFSLWQIWVPGIFPGGEGGRWVGLTNLPPSCPDSCEIWKPQPPGSLNLLEPSGPVQACNGIALPFYKPTG